MVSREGYRLLEETGDISEGSISIPGSWSEFESDEDPWFTESCTAVLEPSKDESRYPDGTLRDQEDDDFFTLSCPEIATDEGSKLSNGKSTNHEEAQQSNSERHNSNEQQSSKQRHKSNEQQNSSERHQSNEQQSSNEHHNSDEQQNSSECRSSNQQQISGDHNTSNEQQNSNEQHNNNEQQNSSENHNINEQQSNSEPHNNNEEQTDEPYDNCCATFLDCYNVNALKIKDSWFIYIFQLFVGLLSVSEIAMGIIFYGNCDPQPSPVPIIAILMGVSGIVLIYNWSAKVRRHRRGEYYRNLEKNILSVFLAIFLFLLILEVAFFSQASPKTIQSKVEVKCIKAYYDYLYYMFFAIGGSLALAASLYLPDCCIYTFTYQAPLPSLANGHYEPL